ncbi:MAG: hypothetical protein WCB46_12565 [Methanoregula sp.]
MPISLLQQIRDDKEGKSFPQKRKNPEYGQCRKSRKVAMTGRWKPVSRSVLMTIRAGLIFRCSHIRSPGVVPGR